jgi:3-oxoacyl-[acyl-carrier-protein] synthase II
MNKVVITGLGTVNALGLDTPSYWDAVKSGTSAIRPVEGFDTDGFASKQGAEVRGFTPSEFIDPMKLRRMDRLSQMVLVSSIEAMKDAGLDGGAINPERLGVVIGNGYGGTSCTEEFFEGLLLRGPSGVNPMLFPTTVPNSAASLTSIELKLKGPNCTFCQKDVSAEEAIIYAVGLLRKGAADAIIAGGGEELDYVIYHAFSSLNVLSQGGKAGPEGCFPFDRRRNGRVLGEGAGVLVLETVESAMKRGARVYAEVAGVSMSGGTVGVSTYCMDHKSAARAMTVALSRAGAGVSDVDYISSSANSTRMLDACETAAVKEAFGTLAKKIPISSIRPMTGDFEGMGGLRLLTSVLAMRDGYLPPTLNYHEAEPGLDLDYVPGTGRTADIRSVLHSSIGNGGACACIVLRKPSAFL